MAETQNNLMVDFAGSMLMLGIVTLSEKGKSLDGGT